MMYDGSVIQHQEKILEAIDQLRRRKARPDIQRICNYIMRKFSVNWNDAKEDLMRCVEKEVVLKVEYKGSISYRNAAKKFSYVKQVNSENNQLITYGKPNKKFIEVLTNSLAELIVNEPDYVEGGVPESELVRKILSKDSLRYSKKYVSILLDKQVQQGGLYKMENGNYSPGMSRVDLGNDNDDSSFQDQSIQYEWEKASQKIAEVSIKRSLSESGGNSDDGKNYPNDSGHPRVGSRRKRAKKVFDPSDNNLPKKRGRPVGSLNKATIEKHLQKFSDYESRPSSQNSYSNREHGGVCSVCHNNKKSSNDRMVGCRECSNKAHISCLTGGDDMMLKMYPDNTWQCPHCKTCRICFETSDAGNLTVCSVCADAYHASCHKPEIDVKIDGGSKWICINCQMPEPDQQLQLQLTSIHPNIGSGNIIRHKLITDDVRERNSLTSSDEDSCSNISPNSPVPPVLSPQGEHRQRSVSVSPELKCNTSDSQSSREFDIEDLVDPSIPDARNWTCDEVYNYFLQYFPREEAEVFKEMEIDGCSLLLMKRADVVEGLKLKLGPALRMFRHVVKLQFRRDDPRLYWL